MTKINPMILKQSKACFFVNIRAFIEHFVNVRHCAKHLRVCRLKPSSQQPCEVGRTGIVVLVLEIKETGREVKDWSGFI